MCKCIALLILVGSSVASLGHASTVLITGADRGLGLEFATQYAARGDTVIATCRHPGAAAELQALAGREHRVVIEQLDVASDDDIKALAAKYKGKPIDLLINNAGIIGKKEEQSLGTFSRKSFHDVLDVNTYGALAVAEAFRENVSASQQKKIISITSGFGSISSASKFPVYPYYYCVSKTALNMAMQMLGAELKPRGVIVAVVSPGAVATDMQAEVATEYKVDFRPISKSESVRKAIATVDGLGQAKAQSGMISYDGSVHPW